ncbi:hypothetical protein TNCV_1203681 [Trichonephila clavipes]|nr:hypothetical protein TNCV_1203681 [Trichonephila clavipes]
MAILPSLPPTSLGVDERTLQDYVVDNCVRSSFVRISSRDSNFAYQCRMVRLFTDPSPNAARMFRAAAAAL